MSMRYSFALKEIDHRNIDNIRYGKMNKNNLIIN